MADTELPDADLPALIAVLREHPYQDAIGPAGTTVDGPPTLNAGHQMYWDVTVKGAVIVWATTKDFHPSPAAALSAAEDLRDKIVASSKHWTILSGSYFTTVTVSPDDDVNKVIGWYGGVRLRLWATSA